MRIGHESQLSRLPVAVIHADIVGYHAWPPGAVADANTFDFVAGLADLHVPAVASGLIDVTTEELLHALASDDLWGRDTVEPQRHLDVAARVCHLVLPALFNGPQSRTAVQFERSQVHWR